MRRFVVALVLSFSMGPLQCATLERLSLTDMITKSTAIVRGKVMDSYAAFSGRVIYTHYRIQVAERFKGTVAATVDVAVPGGTADGVVQNFSGVPQFQAGGDYVFFLWTGKSGVTQVIGLTQGVFATAADGTSDPAVKRTASRELMLDRTTHQQVKDETLTMRLSDLRSRIAATLGVAK